MPRVITQRDLSQVRRLGFCYLCGAPFKNGEDRTRDHIPPSSLFLSEDRDTPLILPTHKRCHQPRSVEDKQIAQLVQLLRGRVPSDRDMHLKFDAIQSSQTSDVLLGLRDFEFQVIVWRWITGFHAALYNQHLPLTTQGTMQAPFPGGKPLKDGHLIDEILPQQLAFVDLIKRNRAATNTDQIRCRNDKCLYECVWTKLDDGRAACVFGLQIYNWEDLGDIHHFPTRGCVGMYFPRLGIPLDASVATQLAFRFSNLNVLLPFSE